MSKNEAAANLDTVVKAWMEGQEPSLEEAVRVLAAYVMSNSAASHYAKILARVMVGELEEMLSQSTKGEPQVPPDSSR